MDRFVRGGGSMGNHMIKRLRLNDDNDAALLINRKRAAKILNCSVMTLKRMQWEGKLHGIQLRPGPTSPFLYRKADVYKLAGIDA